jgi:hypothetical protein
LAGTIAFLNRGGRVDVLASSIGQIWIGEAGNILGVRTFVLVLMTGKNE